MILSIVGEGALCVGELRPDTSVENSRMHMTEIVAGNITTPCVVRKVVYGSLENLNGERTTNFSLIVFNRLRHTAHTRKGFVDVQITTKPVQFSVYIHLDSLEDFLGACSMSIVRTGLKL